jgi:hypothetical protein
MVRTLEAAAAWVEEVGLALLFPKADVVLPSLWEQVNGSPERNWSIRDDEGNFVRWSKPLSFLWGAKDDLPAEQLVCVGKHVARVATCVAPRLLPLLVAAAEPAEAGVDEQAVEAAVSSEGPLTGLQLRDLTGLSKKAVDKTLATLHRRLVLTNSHLVEQEGPWGAIAHDLLARKWGVGDGPPPDEARRELARLVLDQAGELTAADLAGPFGWRRKEAAAILETLGEGRDEDGFRIWAAV